MIQRRLHFWLVSNGMREDIDNVDVIPSLKSDHSAIVLSINGIENRPRGPSFWKLNSSLLDDKEYVSLINMKYALWNDEFKNVNDPRLFWDLGPVTRNSRIFSGDIAVFVSSKRTCSVT